MGPSGSGKTSCARALSRATGLHSVNLDDLYWVNEGGGWNRRRDKAERATLLESAAAGENWITEGVYYSWLGPIFHSADFIFYLDVPRPVRTARLLRRFVERRLAGDHRESPFDLLTLLRWDRTYLPGLEAAYRELAASRGGVMRVRGRKEIFAALGLSAPGKGQAQPRL